MHETCGNTSEYPNTIPNEEVLKMIWHWYCNVKSFVMWSWAFCWFVANREELQWLEGVKMVKEVKLNNCFWVVSNANQSVSGNEKSLL